MKRETTLHELRAIDYICAFDMQMLISEEPIKERLKSFPDGWRQFRIMRAASEKVVTGLLDTLDRKTMLHITRMLKNGEVIVRPKPIIQDKELQFVDDKDLRVLINSAMESRCSFCMKDYCEMKHCDLRKSLMTIAPPEELMKDGSCPYRNVALNSKLGEYI